MAAVPTMLVLYPDGSQVRINEADFDPELHRMPATAGVDHGDDHAGDAGDDDAPDAPPKRKPRRK